MTEPSNQPENGTEPGPQPIFLLPSVVTAMCGLLAAVHLARAFILNEVADSQLIAWFAFIPFRVLVGQQDPGAWVPLIWTPFTHALLHAGWDHLLFNTAWLAIFATPVARRYGAVAPVAIFALGAVAGAIAFAATTLPQIQILVGASGGVAGLTGAAVRFMFQPVIVGKDPETGEVVALGRRLASLREVMANPRSRYFTLIWVILNAAIPLLPLFTGEQLQVAWQAHLGGFVAGFVLVPLFERRPKGDES